MVICKVTGGAIPVGDTVWEWLLLGDEHSDSLFSGTVNLNLHRKSTKNSLS